MFSSSTREVNKNIFVTPIYSSQMNEIITDAVRPDTDISRINSIQQYESNFIYYIFKELLINQITDFNPSLVVVSYSGKLCI
jgi:hypothetical protein